MPRRVGRGKKMTPGNYLEHAAEYFWTTEHQIRQAIPGEAGCLDYFKGLIPIALKAPRFLLPHDGLVGTNEKSQFMKLFQPVRLPYPVIVLEFSATRGRTIVVAMESNIGGPCISTYTFLSWNDGNPHAWEPRHLCVSADTTGNPVIPVRDGKNTKYGLSLFVTDLNTNRGVSEIDPYRAEIHAIWVLLSLLLALQCCNVKTENVPVPIALNKKRVERKKLPFVEYKILTVGTEHAGSLSGSGTHASPRQHIRRGHIRRITDTRTVWVNQCMVGDPNKGTIVKDYRVTA